MIRKIFIVIPIISLLVLTLNAQESTENEKLARVEKFPEYPGGMEECYKFIRRNIRYENKADKNKEIGIVKVTFVVEKDGSIGEPIKIHQSVSQYYDDEAIRIIKSMPKWEPGIKGGQPVRVRYTIPVKF